MALEKNIIKKSVVETTTFEYKPRELSTAISISAQSFVDKDAYKSNDFKISDIVAQQTGISQLESDAQQDKINAQVLERLKDLEEKAYKEGFELGQIEGAEKAFKESRTELLERLAAFDALLKRIEFIKSQIGIDNEAELVRLVYLTASRLAERDLSENREAVMSILRDVLGEMQTDQRMVVHLSSEDLMFIESLKEKRGEDHEMLTKIQFVADDKIRPGGCLIETPYGTVDATLEVRFDRMWQALQSRIPQKSKETGET